MHVLALEPFYGGSHRALLDGWAAHSRHRFTVLGLPDYKWKWRMRGAAVTLAGETDRLLESGAQFDALFCSDMLNLAEFRGLATAAVARLPAVAYFHENQLTYPVRVPAERDLHFGFTNITTALAASAVWFNSAFHRDEFLAAAEELLRRMPDHQPLDAVAQIAAKSAVQHPGVDDPPPRPARVPGPLRILWAARWEFDKNPEEFFAALEQLKQRGVAFRLSVLGARFRDVPEVFETARERFAARIDRWGYLPSCEDYLAALADADVFVSTADHEFFGIGAVEAIAAGAYPLLPCRLAYPELLAGVEGDAGRFLYEGGAATLAGRLAELAARAAEGDLWGGDPDAARRAVAEFHWSRRAPAMDAALEELTAT